MCMLPLIYWYVTGFFFGGGGVGVGRHDSRTLLNYWYLFLKTFYGALWVPLISSTALSSVVGKISEILVRYNNQCCKWLHWNQLWTTYRSPVMTRISVPYNDVYRWFFKIRRGVSISAIFVSKGIDSFNVLRRKLIYSFMKRIHTSENPG